MSSTNECYGDGYGGVWVIEVMDNGFRRVAVGFASLAEALKEYPKASNKTHIIWNECWLDKGREEFANSVNGIAMKGGGSTSCDICGEKISDAAAFGNVQCCDCWLIRAREEKSPTLHVLTDLLRKMETAAKSVDGISHVEIEEVAMHEAILGKRLIVTAYSDLLKRNYNWSVTINDFGPAE